MCTVTWLLESERVTLFTNRDELRTRRRALPPQPRFGEGGRYLAPVDGDAGGTWIAVNESGLALCLLNDYRSRPPATDTDLVSRGRLVTELIAAPDLPALDQRWSAVDCCRYRPFRLLALETDRKPRLYSWDGRSARIDREGVTMPLCSSSFDDAGADRSRRGLLGSFLDKADLAPSKRLLRFHQSHLPERGPYSVCMHRPDAVTVSFTLVEIEPERVSMAYAAGAPCSNPLDHFVTLERTPG